MSHQWNQTKAELVRFADDPKQSKIKVKTQHWLYIIAFMIARESIYMLPYMRKTFQTSIESTFNVSGTELGVLNSIFGVLALQLLRDLSG